MKSIFKKTFLTSSVTLAFGLALFSTLFLATTLQASAATVSGNTIFKVMTQPVVILDYYKEIDLTIPSAAEAALAGPGSNTTTTQALTAVAAAGSLTANAALVTAGNPVNAVPLDMTNAYSVRAIDTAGVSNTTTVTVAFSAGSTALLTGVVDNTSTIALSNPGTSVAPFHGTGLSSSKAVYGDISMTLDLSNAKSADTYAGATIVITAVST